MPFCDQKITGKHGLSSQYLLLPPTQTDSLPKSMLLGGLKQFLKTKSKSHLLLNYAVYLFLIFMKKRKEGKQKGRKEVRKKRGKKGRKRRRKEGKKEGKGGKEEGRKEESTHIMCFV